jgi:spoIIIJ-associated protein
MESKRAARQNAEYSGRTIEEALRRASEELGVSLGAFEYDIVRDSTRTILGLVRTGEVLVRVSWAEEVQTQQPAVIATTGAADAPSAKDNEERSEDDLGDDLEDEGDEMAPVGGERYHPKLEETACEVVSTLLDKMGVLAAVEVVDHGGKRDAATGDVAPLTLNLVGDDLGMLIGRRGETLRSLQFIVRLIVSRRLGVWPSIVLDVEGYKAKRVVALKALARRMADQVRQTGQMATLEPMPAHERRIVHLALRDDPHVYTESTGEDDRRKVQIIPR